MNLGIIEILLIVLILSVILSVVIRMGRVKATPLVKPQHIADAIHDSVVQEAMQNGRKIEAIRQYRELTGTGLKESKQVIDYVMAGGDIGKKRRSAPDLDMAAGVRDLLNEGRKDQAIDLYARFAGVETYSARDAVEQIERDMRFEDDAEYSPADESELRDLVRQGQKIEAIQRYRELTGAGLKEAKDAVEALE